MSSILEKRPIGEVSNKKVKDNTEFLNYMLANEYALFTKTLNYHWNITGPRFHSLHEFLEGQYRGLLDVMDDVAERIRMMGETPYSTVEQLKNAMDVKERNGRHLSSNEMLEDLFETNLKIQESIKEKLNESEAFQNDFGTEDFLVGMLQKHEKTSWMLKSHLD